MLKKSLGQHFLTDKNMQIKIVKYAMIDKNSSVIEIGPGKGNLTEEILNYTKDITLIELDPEFVKILMLKYKTQEGVRIIQGDGKKLNYGEILDRSKKYIVLGNLPYNQAIPILMRLLEFSELFVSLNLLFQREVAQRMIANPFTKDYGVLTVKLKTLSKVEKLFDIPPECFYPKPKVISSFVRIVPNLNLKIEKKKLKDYFEFIMKCFNPKRKILISNLKFHYPEFSNFIEQTLKEKFPEILNKRAEEISPEIFIHIFKEIDIIKN